MDGWINYAVGIQLGHNSGKIKYICFQFFFSNISVKYSVVNKFENVFVCISFFFSFCHILNYGLFAMVCFFAYRVDLAQKRVKEIQEEKKNAVVLTSAPTAKKGLVCELYGRLI